MESQLLSSIIGSLLLYTLLIISINNFIVGKTSLWPVGHIGFFGIGGFLTGVFIIDAALNPWLALILSLLGGLAISVLIGVITIRLRSDYFVIFSIAFCEIIRSSTIYLKGPAGMRGIERPGLMGIDLGNDWYFIFLVLLPVFLGTVFIAYRFYRTPIERIFALVRNHEYVARLYTLSPNYYKIGTFILGCSIATIVGGLYTLFTRSTDPSTITIYQSIMVFAMVIFGGINSIRGSIIGGLMIIIIPKILEYSINHPLSTYYTAQIVQLMYGLLLIVIIRFMPGGIMGESMRWFYSSSEE